MSHRFPINKEIVEKRSGVSFSQAVNNAVNQLELMDNLQILSGVGELLTPNQKDWAKAKLRQETAALHRLQK